jgi:hypothetical protein
MQHSIGLSGNLALPQWMSHSLSLSFQLYASCGILLCIPHLHWTEETVRERRDGALAVSDLRLLLNQPTRKLGASNFFLF